MPGHYHDNAIVVYKSPRHCGHCYVFIPCFVILKINSILIVGPYAVCYRLGCFVMNVNKNGCVTHMFFSHESFLNIVNVTNLTLC